VSTYAQLVDTRPVLDPVVTEFGLPYDIDHIRANITVNATEQSQILRISVTDSELQRASDIVNSVAVNLVDYVANMEARVGDNAGDATFVFVVAENAIAPKSPYTPRISYLIWVGDIGGFLVLGIVGVFAAVRSNAVNADVEGQQSVQASTLPSVLHQRRRAPTISRFAGRRSEPSRGPIVGEVAWAAPRVIEVIAHRVSRTATALSLQRYLSDLETVVSAEAREFTEGVLRMQVTARSPLDRADLTGWTECGPVSILQLQPGVIEIDVGPGVEPGSR